MKKERVRILFEAYRVLYDEEPQGLDLHGVAMRVIKMAGFLDEDLARRSLHAISRMHDEGEEFKLSVDEKISLERRIGEIGNHPESSEEIE